MRTQVGGTLEIQKKKVLFFCFFLGLHYSGLEPKVGGTSEIQKKKVFSFCFSLGLHYLCRHNYYNRKTNY